MTNIYAEPEKLSMKTRLFQIGVEALKKEGWTVEPIPGSGKGSVRRITRGKEAQVVTIRTTQDTWIAFPRDSADKGWGTLSEVDSVVAVSVDDRDEPRFAKVHLIDGDDMRDRFDRTYAARIQAGHKIPVGRGVWLGLYEQETDGRPGFVGAGAGLVYPPIACVPLFPPQEEELKSPVEPRPATPTHEAPLTISEAKRRLALAFGVDPSNVTITIEA